MKNNIRILAVDDEPMIRNLISESLCQPGYHVETAASGGEAIDAVGKGEFDVVILDINMPDVSGIEVLETIRTKEQALEVIMLTGHATVPTAVEAMKLGAYDFLTKPISLKELTVTVEKAYEKKQLVKENIILRDAVTRQAGGGEIVTENPHLLSVMAEAEKYAHSDFPVMISGETGTGKELLARYIYTKSRSSRGAFIPINCGALPEEMLESELFGYEKGAFTGAVGRKPGLLEIADGGVLFLDEIGEMPLALQGKLLRVIETGRFFRLGGTRETSVEVKYVSATNRKIEVEVAAGRFRQDLYYRVSTLPLVIPPLRERKEDIPLLAGHFIKSIPELRGRSLSSAAHRLLEEYRWPGNVRELINVLHRSFLLAGGDIIGPEELKWNFPDSGGERTGTLEEVEREHIIGILKQVQGHRGKAAAILGINPRTLYRKLLSYDGTIPEEYEEG